MTNIKLITNGAKIRAEIDGILTSGAVGIPVAIQYDSTWDDLTKNLVCTSGKWGPTGKPRTILNVGTSATVAHEVMIADNHLYLGIQGRSVDGAVVIPTVWADCGKIFQGANANADPSANPTLAIWEQLQKQINELKEGETSNENTSTSQNYTLPVATAELLGGVMPVAKADTMIQPVGVDAVGRLYTTPGEVSGTDDYAELANKPAINGVELSGNKTSADLGIGNPTDEQVASAVTTYLDAHPEATTTVADGGITTEKLADGAVTAGKMAAAIVVAEQLLDPDDFRANGVTGFLYNGEVKSGGNAIPESNSGYMTSPFMPVTGGRSYYFNFEPYGVHCYDSEKTWISSVTKTSKANASGQSAKIYAMPENAAYMRWCKSFNIAGGELETWMIFEESWPFGEYFVGKKYALDGASLGVMAGTFPGDTLANGSVPMQKLTTTTTVSQLFNLEEFFSDTAGGNLKPDGTVNGTANSAYRCSDFVEAKPNQLYTCNWKPFVAGVTHNGYGSVASYDSNKAFLGVLVLDDKCQFTTHAETAYIRFGASGTVNEEVCANHMICEGETLFSGYVPGGEKVIIDGLLLDRSTPANSVDGSILLKASIPRNRLAPPDGLKICCYGDSLTQNKYPARVADILGAEVVDAGVGGNTVSAIYNRVGNYGTDFDVVTLMCGTNDNGGVTSCPLGTVDDEAATDDNAGESNTTYAARLKRLINKIKTTHPGATYIIMPPFAHAWGDMGAVADMMEQIAKLYSIPFLDIYHLCGWRGTDAADKEIFMADDTHENDVGAQRIAELLAGFIKQLKGF